MQRKKEEPVCFTNRFWAEFQDFFYEETQQNPELFGDDYPPFQQRTSFYYNQRLNSELDHLIMKRKIISFNSSFSGKYKFKLKGLSKKEVPEEEREIFRAIAERFYDRFHRRG